MPEIVFDPSAFSWAHNQRKPRVAKNPQTRSERLGLRWLDAINLDKRSFEPPVIHRYLSVISRRNVAPVVHDVNASLSIHSHFPSPCCKSCRMERRDFLKTV